MGASGPHHSFTTGDRAGPSKHLVTFEGPCAKTLQPTLPLPSALTLVRPSARRTAFGSGLPASWGLTLTLVQPPRGPSVVGVDHVIPAELEVGYGSRDCRQKGSGGVTGSVCS